MQSVLNSIVLCWFIYPTYFHLSPVLIAITGTCYCPWNSIFSFLNENGVLNWKINTALRLSHFDKRCNMVAGSQRLGEIETSSAVAIKQSEAFDQKF